MAHLQTSTRLMKATFAGALLFATNCSHTPPPQWAEGGSPLAFGTAVWTHVDGSQLFVNAAGQVHYDGDVTWALDRMGRVVDDSNDPVALLDGEGFLFGTNEAYLGRIGLHNAAPPWSSEAWVRVEENGKVTLFDADGEVVSGGQWTGCEGPVMRTCTLLTHLFLLESVRQQSPRPAPYYYPYPGWYWPYTYPYWGMGFGIYY